MFSVYPGMGPSILDRVLVEAVASQFFKNVPLILTDEDKAAIQKRVSEYVKNNLGVCDYHSELREQFKLAVVAALADEEFNAQLRELARNQLTEVVKSEAAHQGRLLANAETRAVIAARIAPKPAKKRK